MHRLSFLLLCQFRRISVVTNNAVKSLLEINEEIISIHSPFYRLSTE